MVPDAGGKKRKFQPGHIAEFPWLTYSAVPGLEGGFCRYCVLMGRQVSGHASGYQALGSFVTEPFKRFKDAKNDLRRHQTTQVHADAVAMTEQVLMKERIGIDELVDLQKKEDRKKREQQEAEYKRRLLPVVQTVLLCGAQELALRGHRDDGPLDLDAAPKRGEGNFKALLRYRAQGDKLLEDNIRTAPKNMQLTSWNVQNQIILICGQMIKENIVEKIKKAEMYTIIADETTDRNKREQLALVLRYVTENGTVREDMVAMLNPDKTTGEVLAQAITDALQKLGLSLDCVRGQAYDGGGNMSGRISGAQSRIRALQPLAVYTHCASHRLNLALGRALTVPGVRNMLGIVSVASNFFNDSAARVQLLEEKVEELGEEQKKKRLKALCRTRWVEQHESLLTFEQLLVPIVAALEHVEREGSSDSAQKASGHLAAITRFEFLICLEMAVLLFGVTLGLSICLQNPQQSLSDAIKKISRVQRAVEDAREEFPAVMAKAVVLAEKLDVPVIAPRSSSRQVHRPNSSKSADPETYYRINVFLPFIDQMIKELKERFPEDHPGLQLEGVLPSRIETADLSAVIEGAEAYHTDLPNPANLRSELLLWRTMVAQAKSNRPQTAEDAFQMTGSLPNVRTLLQILMTLPVTSCSAERTFSTLKRVETDQRTTMGEDRLESLILMSAHGVTPLDPSIIADRFVRARVRRSV